MRRAVGAAMFFLTLFKMAAAETDYSPPGKPTLTSCMSRDKETFTCWWDPSEGDDRLHTTYALYYLKENSDVVHACPDDHSAGENSCYFNKNSTSIWVNYNITVAATNAHGSSYSEPVVVDVAYIVQPHTPENVTVAVLEDKDGTFFRVSWEPPHKADTRSGWITLIYELRAKLEGADWEEHFAGQQKMFNIFSLRSGGTYLIQVRCKPLHGFWSEWSPTVNVTAPGAMPQEGSTLILIAFFSALIFLLLTWILNVKSRSVKRCLFPPVPGPKIRGLDIQLLKNGQSDDVFNALAMPGFPPMTHCDYKDQLVYLEVSGHDERELMLAEAALAAGPCCAGAKSEGSPSDSDSGHGSCDSHTLLMEKCGEGEAVKVEDEEEEEKRDGEAARRRSRGETQGWERRRASWVEEEEEKEEDHDGTEGRVKTWPSLFVTPEGRPGTAKQLFSSDHSFSPPPSPPPPLSATSSSARQARRGLEKHRAPEGPRWQSCSCSEISIHGMEPKRQHPQGAGMTTTMTTNTAARPAQPRSPFRATDYVEVQRVSRENMVVLRPIPPAAAAPPGEVDYSRVKGLNAGDVLLLQRAADAEAEPEEEGREEEKEEEGAELPRDTQEKSELWREGRHVAPPAVLGQMPGNGKPSAAAPGLPSAASLREDMVLTVNGYVDTAVALMPAT